MATKKQPFFRTLKEPVRLSMRLPPGSFDDVVQILIVRASKLVGFSDNNSRELSRAVVDMAGIANPDSSVTLRVEFDKPRFLIALQAHDANDGWGRTILDAWEKKKAHRLMDEARLEGDPHEVVLTKQLP